jgi:putative salt-induced outer membrane protein YdiY
MNFEGKNRRRVDREHDHNGNSSTTVSVSTMREIEGKFDMISIIVSGATVQAQEEKEQTPWKTQAELSYFNSSGNSDSESLSVKL